MVSCMVQTCRGRARVPSSHMPSSHTELRKWRRTPTLPSPSHPHTPSNRGQTASETHDRGTQSDRFGTLTGSMLPFILRRLGFDPATASAPFVATLVDVTGLCIYFGVAL